MSHRTCLTSFVRLLSVEREPAGGIIEDVGINVKKQSPAVSDLWDSDPFEWPRTLSGAIDKVDLALTLIVDTPYQWFRRTSELPEALDDVGQLKALLVAKIPRLKHSKAYFETYGEEYRDDAQLRSCNADAWIALARARRSAADGDVEGAWEHVSVAQSALSDGDGAYEVMCAEELRKNGVKGAEVQNTKLGNIRDKCESLLREKRPKRGWRGLVVARDAIIPELTEFLEASGWWGDGLWIDQLDKWLAEPGPIRDALNGKAPQTSG